MKKRKLLFYSNWQVLGALLLLVSITASFRLQENEVFYCDSPTGKKYHFSRNCRGLKNCTHTIRKTTIELAEKSGLAVCLIEKK